MRPYTSSSTSVFRIVISFVIGIGIFLSIYALLNWVLLRVTEQPSAIPSNSNPVTLPTSPTPVVQENVFQSTTNVLPSDGPPGYGHLPYVEANPQDLMIVASYGLRENQRYEKLHSDAAFALMKLTNAARDDGVWIILSSGFRGYDKQAELFEYQTQKRGSPEEAAKSSAPLGYSEHHTGLTVDLADGHTPDADVNQSFADTEAFEWLLQYGEEFGFELSFPRDNHQGVSYEPWHWRFVGTPQAQEVFSRARSSE